MKYPLNVDVHCTDGRYGRSSRIILNPATEKITHIVVKQQKAPHTEYLVPVRWIRETTPELILLDHTKEEIANLDLFNQTDFVQRDVPHYAKDPKLVLLWPYVVPAKKIFSQKFNQVPPGQLAVRRGAKVKATDGVLDRLMNLLSIPKAGILLT